MIGIAKPGGGLDHRVEHGLQIEGRATDNLQHVAGRGLVFQRFLKIGGALAQLVEQPRILHRDHRLRGEILHQRDLLVGERPDFRARGGDHAEQHIVLAQRYKKTRTHAGKLERRPDHRMVDLRQVGKVNEAGAGDQRSGDRIVGAAIPLPQLFLERARIGVCRHRAESLAIAQHQGAMGHSAEPVRLFQYRIEHRREIAGRRIDDLQHLGGRGLLLQRLALLGQQPRVLDRDHRLIGEGADKFDLSVGERLDPLAGEHDDTDRFAFAQQRHAERCSLLAQPDGLVRIAWNGGHVVNMHGAAFADGSAERQSAIAGPMEQAPVPSQ